MKLTRERKILVTILAVGLGALVFDRCVLGDGATGPASAHAAVLSTVSSQAPKTSEGAATLVQTSALFDPAPGESGLTERLAAIAQRHDLQGAPVRDAFAPDTAWVRAHTAQPAAEQQADLVKQFNAKHQLLAVMASGTQQVAIVDGQAMTVGQRLGAATLTRINPRSVVFTVAGHEVTLSLHH